MKKNTITSLSKIINNKIKRKTKGFQPVFDVKIKNKTYLFGIPFTFQMVNSKSNVKFNVKELKSYFPHFEGLDNEIFSLNSGYNNILDVTKIVTVSKVNQALVNLINIKTVYDSLITNGFLLLKNDCNLAIEESLDLDFNLELSNNSKKQLNEVEIENVRKNIKIDNFKEIGLNDLIELAKKEDIFIPEKPNKSYFTQIMTEIAIFENTENRKITKKEKQKIIDNLLEMTNTIIK